MAQCLSFYTWCSSLGVNCYLYTDVKRTTTVSAGWVSDGTTNWHVNSSGMIDGSAACSYNVHSYLMQTNGYAGTVSWVDCNGTPQSVYDTGMPGGVPWYAVAVRGIDGSFSFAGSAAGIASGGCYLYKGMPCNCNDIDTCESYSVSATGNGNLNWVDCNGTFHTQYLTNGQTYNVCAKKGRIWNFASSTTIYQDINNQNTSPGATAGITDNGACLPYGTFINTICYGCDLYNIRADGNGGTYQEYVEPNSTSCGCGALPCYTFYVYDYGPVSYTDCYGNSVYQYFNSGESFCANSVSYGAAYTFNSECI